MEFPPFPPSHRRQFHSEQQLATAVRVRRGENLRQGPVKETSHETYKVGHPFDS